MFFAECTRTKQFPFSGMHLEYSLHSFIVNMRHSFQAWPMGPAPYEVRSCLDLLRSLYKHLVIDKIQCEMCKYKHEVPCHNNATHIIYIWFIHCVYIMCVGLVWKDTQCMCVASSWSALLLYFYWLVFWWTGSWKWSLYIIYIFRCICR